MQPKLPQAAIFDIGPCLNELCRKYQIQQPLNSHDYMVLNIWIAEAFERIFTLIVTPHPSIYDNSPLNLPDLTIIGDVTLDTFLTKTVSLPLIYQCIAVGSIRMRSRISVTSLIIEM